MKYIFPVRISKSLLESLSGLQSSGHIHTVFESCLNGLIDNSISFNVIPENRWINPRTIELTQKNWTSIKMSNLQPHDSFLVAGHTMYIEKPDIAIDFKDVCVWDPEELLCFSLLPKSEILKNTKVARSMLLMKRKVPHLRCVCPSVFRDILIKRILTLRSAIQQGSDVSIENAASSLIGLGPGLTPAGDDFIVGLIAALRVLRRHNVAANHCSGLICKMILSIGQGSTNLISHEALLDGAYGRFSSVVTECVKHILCIKHGELNRCLQGILSVGASSGYFFLAGILLAVDSFVFSPEGTSQ